MIRYIDVYLRSCDSSESTQKYTQFPFERTVIHLFNKRQVSIIARYKYNLLALYFDATGSVVRPSQHEVVKRALYFAGVVNINRRIVSLFQLISSRHDALQIGNFVRHFEYFVITTCHKEWPLFYNVVSDWSVANLISLCLGLNDMTLFLYLRKIHCLAW